MGQFVRNCNLTWLHCVLLGSLFLGAFRTTTGNSAPNAFLFETFGDGWDSRWIHSSNAKYDGKFTVDSSAADPELRVPAKDKHYGLTALLPKGPLDPADGVVVQYEAKYGESSTCGGSYVKLLTYDNEFDAHELVDTTPYTIMFGPDKCGDGKIHLILRHRNPINGTVTEKHLKPHPKPITDTLPHVYTLVIRADNMFEVLVDGRVVSSGSLLEMLDPPINPPREIPDPEDEKPEDWVDEAMIPDPSAVQPADWDMRPVLPDESAVKPKGWLDDEPEEIPDPAARKPAGWDNEDDGEWEAPMIANPKCRKVGCGEWQRPMKTNPDYKGAWRAPHIDNPAYKGPWVQKTIPNPDFYEDSTPLRNIGSIGAVAFEIWTVDEGYAFDNLYIGKDAQEALELREALWRPKFDEQKKAYDEKLKTEGDELERKKMESLKKAQMAGQGLSDTFLRMFDEGMLKSAKPYVGPLLDVVRSNPQSIYIILAAPMLLIILAAAIRLASLPSTPAYQAHVGEEKSDDEAEADKAVKEKDSDANKGSEPPNSGQATDTATNEIMPQADEGEEPQGPSTRRRSRRAA